MLQFAGLCGGGLPLSPSGPAWVPSPPHSRPASGPGPRRVQRKWYVSWGDLPSFLSHQAPAPPPSGSWFGRKAGPSRPRPRQTGRPPGHPVRSIVSSWIPDPAHTASGWSPARSAARPGQTACCSVCSPCPPGSHTGCGRRSQSPGRRTGRSAGQPPRCAPQPGAGTAFGDPGSRSGRRSSPP